MIFALAGLLGTAVLALIVATAEADYLRASWRARRRG